MEKNIFRKGMVFAVIVLFIGTGIVPSISSDEPVSKDMIFVDDNDDPGWYDATHVKTSISYNGGSIIINGPPGDNPDVDCWAHDLSIYVSYYGEIVTLSANYSMNNINGADDHAYCDFKFSDDSDSDSDDLGEGSKSGTLSISKFMYPNETHDFRLHGLYKDFITWPWWEKTLDEDFAYGTVNVLLDEPWLTKSIMCDWVNGFDVHGVPKTEFDFGQTCYSYIEIDYNDSEINDSITWEWEKNGVIHYTSYYYLEDAGDYFYCHSPWIPDEIGEWTVDIYYYGQYLDKYLGNESFQILPVSPQNLNAFNATGSSIYLNWTKDNEIYETVVIGRTDGYPNSPDSPDGRMVYSGFGNSTLDLGLNPNTTHFYRAWSKYYDSSSQKNFYSTNFSQDNETTLVIKPLVTTLPVIHNSSNFSELRGFLNNDGGEECQILFQYKEIDAQDWIYYPDDWFDSYSTGDIFLKDIYNLTGNTMYVYKAGVKNSAGVTWGEIVRFETEPGPPEIKFIESYFADGSNASNGDGFLLQGIDLINTYNVTFHGGDVDSVEFIFGVQSYSDINGDDGWRASFNFLNLHPSDTLTIKAENTYGSSEKTYYPKIISMEGWLWQFLNYTYDNNETNFVTFSTGIKEPVQKNNNYWTLDASVDFSTGCPENPSESPMNAYVPDGVPVDDFGGEYGFSGGIGSSVSICSDRTIDVGGDFQASVSACGFGGGIGAELEGSLQITDPYIVWKKMNITINGDVKIPVLYVPLSIQGYGFAAGVDITPHVEVTFELEPCDDPNDGLVPGLGIKIKDDAGINGNIGCRLRAYCEANFVIAYLYVEASGDATLYFKTPPDDQGYFDDFVLSARIGGKLRVLRWNTQHWWTYQWSYPGGKLRDTVYEETDWEPLNRSYLHPDQQGYCNIPWDDYIIDGTVIENVFPYAKPNIAYNVGNSRGDEVMMVWSHDNSDKSSIKSMEIGYTLWDKNNGIVELNTINATVDDKLQMDPQMTYDKNGNGICVFVQLDSSISENTSILDVFNATEIAYCVWDGISWSTINSITSNNWMDVSPMLASNANGDIVLIWTSDTDNNFSTLTDRIVYASFWNGSNWSNAIKIVENYPIISGGNVALNDDGEAIYVFGGKEDEDQNIYYTTFGLETKSNTQQFTFDPFFNDTSPSVIYGKDGYPYIIWLKNKYINETEYDGNLYYKRVDQNRMKSNSVLIKRGAVYDPLAFQSSSSVSKFADGDVNFAVGWKSGTNSNELRLTEIPIDYRLADKSENDDIIYSSEKKLSDVNFCFAPEGILAAVTERNNLSDDGKNCDLSLIYTNTNYNSPPYIPTNPMPDTGTLNINIDANLSWTGEDPDGDNITYDVFFSTVTPPLKIASNQSNASYDPGTMSSYTKYYWKIIAHDSYSHTTEGSIWNFTTENQPPIANTGGSYTGHVNKDITFDGSNSYDPDGIITGYQWDFNNDGTYDTNWSASPTTKHCYSAVGTYTLKLQVKDDGGLIDVDATTVIVSNPNGGGNNPPFIPPDDTNKPPIADASAGGESYYGFVGYEVAFDGSNSYDPDEDGYIESWSWDFGDGTNGTMEIVTHTYSSGGIYTVILTVTDNEGAEDTYETIANISQSNNPPSKPLINGPTTGTVNTEYEYTAVSTDPDNDTIKYSIIWGDQTSSITESAFMPSGTVFSANHTWIAAGKCTINMEASDNHQTESGTSSYTVYIDAIQTENIGYLVDTDVDGIYDSFHNETNGHETDVEYKDGKYLIDDNGDDKWDYTYNLEEGLKTYAGGKEDDTPGFELIFAFVALAFILFCKRKRKY